MSRTILITGSTDGLGLAAARELIRLGEHVLIHGRNHEKVQHVYEELTAFRAGPVSSFCADLSDLKAVIRLATQVSAQFDKLDVLINNAGVFHVANPMNADGLDVRFVVNAFAPVLLTTTLASLLGSGSRVINLSSAAQQRVHLEALRGQLRLDHFSAYAQSKLALTMWSRQWSQSAAAHGRIVTALNPGSMLGTNMVQKGFGVAGSDLHIGSRIITQAAIGAEFGAASGLYFDNDTGAFTEPHADAMNDELSQQVISAMTDTIASITM